MKEIAWSAGPANSEEDESDTCLHNTPESAILEFLEDLDKYEYPNFVNLYWFEVNGGIEQICKTEVCIKALKGDKHA